jgi:formamidopyrimidine-DNA glycosylase
MIELPETYVLAEQIEQTLVGKTIRRAAANTHPHGFAMYTGDPAAYGDMLAGKKITMPGADLGTGDIRDCNVEIICGDMRLSISTPIKYHAPGEKLPKSHQLLLEFEDGSHMSCTVQMWGSMLCVPLSEIPERHKQGPSPLADAFDETYFDGLRSGVKPSMSAKAFLATEKRIPGLGNGVLQDILFNARIHPKRKLQTMNDEDMERLFRSVKSTLRDMRERGGRDTEKDLFGHKGGYRTILSSNTQKYPCRVCGGGLIREAYLGGNIYFCPNCQPLDIVR